MDFTMSSTLIIEKENDFDRTPLLEGPWHVAWSQINTCGDKFLEHFSNVLFSESN